MDAITEELLAQIIARDVACGVEMARSIGHRMPLEYDVGFTRKSLMIGRLPGALGVQTVITLRLDDATYDVRVLVPYLDGRTTLAQVDELWNDLVERLHSASLTLAHVWLDKHPDAQVKGEEATAALAKLAALGSTDIASDAWLAVCRRKAQAARYQRVR